MIPRFAWGPPHYSRPQDDSSSRTSRRRHGKTEELNLLFINLMVVLVSFLMARRFIPHRGAGAEPALRGRAVGRSAPLNLTVTVRADGFTLTDRASACSARCAVRRNRTCVLGIELRAGRRAVGQRESIGAHGHCQVQRADLPTARPRRQVQLLHRDARITAVAMRNDTSTPSN